MTNTPWILTQIHLNPDCLEWIISTTRPAANGCKADPRGRTRRKHVEFKAAKHTIVAGNLCHQADPLWVIGRITRCYSEPDRDDTTAVTDACSAGQPPHALLLIYGRANVAQR